MINSDLGPITVSDIWPVFHKGIFFLPPSFNLKFRNVSLKLHAPNFVPGEPQQRANYSCKNLSPNTYPKATVHT